MTYDVAVWVGAIPSSPQAADEEFERRMDQLEEADGDLTPAPELLAYVEAALALYPALDDAPEGAEGSDDDCPWASAPLADEIVGDTLYFPLTWTGAEYARDPLAELAASMGLVCYDPQEETLLPSPPAHRAVRAAERRPRTWFGRLLGR
jgi:hypothetical protein